MPKRCPECGGEIIYNRDLKMYICTRCGRMYVREELEDLLERAREKEVGRDLRSRRV
ncbi:MAG: hypothetical protein QXP94_01455 [Thermofilaceae archaeon]